MTWKRLLSMVLVPTALAPTASPFQLISVPGPDCAELMRGAGAPKSRPTSDVAWARVTVDGAQGQSSYSLDLGNGRPVRSNDAAVLLTALKAQAATSATPAYLDLSELGAKRRAALRASLEIANGQAGVPLRFVEDLEPLLAKAARRERLGPIEVGRVEIGPQAGLSFARADALIAGRAFVVTAYCRIAEAARAFMERLRRAFSGPASSGESTIAVVNRVRKQVAAQYRLSPDDLQVAFGDLQRTQFVDARGLEPGHAW